MSDYTIVRFLPQNKSISKALVEKDETAQKLGYVSYFSQVISIKEKGWKTHSAEEFGVPFNS